MNRNLRVILAVVATLALSGLAVASAQATKFRLS